MFDLRNFRADHDMTQKDLAALFDCTQVNISLIETGKNDITTEQINKLVASYGEDDVMRYVVREKDVQEPVKEQVNTIPLQANSKEANMYNLILKQMDLINSQSAQIARFQDQIDKMIDLIKEKL